jgi:hypothetical protein
VAEEEKEEGRGWNVLAHLDFGGRREKGLFTVIKMQT